MSPTIAPPIIDVCTHVFPDPITHRLPVGARETLKTVRRSVRTLFEPLSRHLHTTQPDLRHLPQGARDALDEIGSVLPLPGLLIESTVFDLLESMQAHSVSHSLILSHPPTTSNGFVIECMKESPTLHAVVGIEKTEKDPSTELKAWAERGAVALKLHPVADHETLSSKIYRDLLNTAADLNIPVIVQARNFQSHILYGNADTLHPLQFGSWFQRYSHIPFIIAHLNLHEPDEALQIIEHYPNVYADTSWQPEEVIAEGVRRVGAEKLLFGSGWPFLGNNLKISLDRIQNCLDSQMMNESQAKLILSGNALRVFNLNSHHAT